jgi:hypothetical protein
MKRFPILNLSPLIDEETKSEEQVLELLTQSLSLGKLKLDYSPFQIIINKSKLLYFVSPTATPTF